MVGRAYGKSTATAVLNFKTKRGIINHAYQTAPDNIVGKMTIRSLDESLLDRYHRVLLANGVSGYDRRALREDYRLSVLWLILRPIGQAASKFPPRVWWPNLERIMLAVDDLGCRDLLS